MRFFGPHDVPWCPPRLTNLSAAPFLFGPAAPFPFRARWPREAPWTKDRRAWSGNRPAHQSVVVYLLITPYIARYIYYYLLNIYYMSWLVDVRWFFFNCITESGVKWSLLISSVHELRQEVAGKLFVSAHLRRVRRDFWLWSFRCDATFENRAGRRWIWNTNARIRRTFHLQLLFFYNNSNRTTEQEQPQSQRWSPPPHNNEHNNVNFNPNMGVWQVASNVSFSHLFRCHRLRLRVSHAGMLHLYSS